MSLISRLRAVVAGDDYLDGELDGLTANEAVLDRTLAARRGVDHDRDRLTAIGTGHTGFFNHQTSSERIASRNGQPASS